MVIELFLYLSQCVRYTLSTDKKTFTAFVSVDGVPEPLPSDVVQESKMHTIYIKVNVTEGINALLPNCFSGCKSLQYVTLAGTVSSIGSKAFLDCSSLLEIDFPFGTKTLDDCIMMGCSSLKKITLPSTIESVGVLILMYTKVTEIKIAYNNKFSTNQEKTLLIENGTIILAMAPGVNKITIPKEIVSFATDSMSYTSSLSTIDFEENSSLTTVSRRAFCQSGITSIELPYGTLRVLSDAFLQASNLNSIYFPSTVVEVDITCLSNIQSLSNVTIGPQCIALESDSDGVIFIKSDNSILFMPTTITKFTIPNKTLLITSRTLQTKAQLVFLKTEDEFHPKFFVHNNNTLYDKTSMELIACIGGAKIVKVHPNCSAICSGAFYSVGVEEVNMEGTKVSSISSEAFGQTKALAKITFSDSLESMGSWTFSGSSVPSLIFPNKFRLCYDNIISGSSVSFVDLSKCDRLKSISNSMFQNAYMLSTIKLPESGSGITIGVYAFRGCSSLTKVTIETSITSISDGAFLDSSLSVLEFKSGSNLAHIGSSAFGNCKLVSISFPDSVGEIEEYAFSNCRSLSNVEFGPESKLKSVSPFTFNGCNISSLKFGKNLCRIFECGFSGCSTLESIELYDGNQNLSAFGGCLYSKNKTIFIACPPGLQSVHVEKETSVILGSAFYECKKLNNVKFDEDSEINEIGSSTFFGCESLSNLSFPRSLKVLKRECFKKCKRLRSVVFPSECEIEIVEMFGFSESGLRLIDFRGCKSLKILSESGFEGCSELKIVILPPSLRIIESNCFRNCPHLLSIEYCPKISPDVPFDVPDIGIGVFSGCNGLTGIIVPINYPQDSFGEIVASRTLDSDCNLPTVQFSMQSSNIASPAIFSICGEVSEGA